MLGKAVISTTAHRMRLRRRSVPASTNLRFGRRRYSITITVATAMKAQLIENR